MPSNLITGDKAIQSALKVPNDEIRAAAAARARGELAAQPKLRRLSDGDGLYLLMCVKGLSHAWRLDYTFRGRRKTLSLGVYPRIGLATARARAVDARRMLDAGSDPSAERKTLRSTIREEIERERLKKAGKPLPNSFEEVARRWSTGVHSTKVAEGTVATTLRRLEQHVFPWLGARHIGAIEPPEVLECLRRIEQRGTVETAHRTRDACGQVFRFAVAEGKCSRDITADLRDALKVSTPTKHAAITDPKQLQPLMLAIDTYKGTLAVRTALQLSALVFQRPGEVRKMRWPDVDLDRCLWTIPGADMKRRKKGNRNTDPHLVPLSRQAVRLLGELQVTTGHGAWVFPGARGNARAMSDAAVNQALTALGFKADVMTAHGFRATARTILAEVLNVESSVIEAQLAHKVKDANGDSYNRTKWVDQRLEMMQLWADFLDDVRVGRFVKRMPPAEYVVGQRPPLEGLGDLPMPTQSQFDELNRARVPWGAPISRVDESG